MDAKVNADQGAIANAWDAYSREAGLVALPESARAVFRRAFFWGFGTTLEVMARIGGPDFPADVADVVVAGLYDEWEGFKAETREALGDDDR